MRKIYTLLLALIASTAVWAQNPDPSKWEPGENVIKDLGMGDVDINEEWTLKNRFYNNNSDSGDYGQYWQGVGQKFLFDYIDINHDVDPNSNGSHLWGDHDKSIGGTCAGFYGDGHVEDEDPNIYQIVYFPAGHYTIRVQGCYRDASGQQTDACIAAYQKGNSKKNAWAYVETYASKEAAEEGTDIQRTFKTAIRHIGSTTESTQLLNWDPDGGGWRPDASIQVVESAWDPDEEDYVQTKKTYWFPRSAIGASIHYKKGNFWNEFDILLKEGAYVRIGLRKTAYIEEDWLSFGGWEVIFNSANPSDDIRIEFDQQEIDNETAKLEELSKQFSTTSFAGFGSNLPSAIVDCIGDDISMASTASIEISDIDDLDKYVDELKQKTLDYEELYQYLGHLSYLLERSKALLESDQTFPGYTEFENAYNQILGNINGASASDFDEENTPYDFLMKNFNELADARGDYLDSQEADENGAKDFSAVIHHPWFVFPEYEPTKKEDGSWSIDEETWQDLIGQSDGTYADKVGERTQIADPDEIVLNDKTVKNKWFQRMKMEGKSNGLSLYYDDRGLIGAADTWHAGVFTSGSMDVCQNIVGLPSGYYSLKALIRGWGDGKGEYHNIFMENTAGEVMKSPLVPADDSGWQEVTTGIIHVADRQLLIGGQSDYLAHYTGFRLLFYGEEPPVENLLAQEIEEVQAMLADDAVNFFKGDVAKVNVLIAKCVKPFTIENFDEYRGYLAEARKYITDAKKAYANNKAVDTYSTLINDYGTLANVTEIVSIAQLAALDLGDGENDVYTDIEGSNNLANKYGDYLKVYQSAVGFQDDNLQNILSGHVAALKAAVADIKTLEKYSKELSLPININKMKEMGALAATSNNPVDITDMLVNPSFELEEVNGAIQENDAWERGHRYGWETNGQNANSNEYSRGNYEVWNSDPFYFNQVLAGMPSGTYRLSCYAIYRDGRHVLPEMVKIFDETGSEETWSNHNAQIYAKTASAEAFNYLKAIEALKGMTTRNYTDLVSAYEINEDNNEPYATGAYVLGLDEDTRKYDYPEMKWTHIAKNPATDKWAKATKGEDGNWSYEDNSDNDPYPFDEEVVVDGTTYYFPGSMYGFYMHYMDPTQKAKMFNSVEITIKNGETLELGLRKDTKIDGDWVIFDDFKLEYLGGLSEAIEDATEIEEIASEKAAESNVLYNTAGQIVDKSYKGVVIDSTGKKIFQQ